MTSQDLAFNLAAIGATIPAIDSYQESGIVMAVGAWLGVFFLGGIVLTVIFALFAGK